MTTLSNGTDTITPDEVNGFRSTRRPTTIAHTIIGRPDPDVTYGQAGLRTGTLTLVFDGDDESLAAEQLLAAPGTWVLDDVDRPSVNMAFVVPDVGDIGRELDPATSAAWLVTFPFVEVTP